MCFFTSDADVSLCHFNGLVRCFRLFFLLYSEAAFEVFVVEEEEEVRRRWRRR